MKILICLILFAGIPFSSAQTPGYGGNVGEMDDNDQLLACQSYLLDATQQLSLHLKFSPNAIDQDSCELVLGGINAYAGLLLSKDTAAPELAKTLKTRLEAITWVKVNETSVPLVQNGKPVVVLSSDDSIQIEEVLWKNLKPRESHLITLHSILNEQTIVGSTHENYDLTFKILFALAALKEAEGQKFNSLFKQKALRHQKILH